MSFFGVTLETIESVKNHPNADRLDVCGLKNLAFSFVTGRNEYVPGDKVYYFPIDSVIPENILERMGLVGKLAGGKKNRVKTACLRGVYSQGLVIKPEKLLGITPRLDAKIQDTSGYEQETFLEASGITKYEPPIVPCKWGTLLPLPKQLSMYDIEGIGRFPHIVDMLLDVEVVITEKLEGSNFSITEDETGKIFVNQRSFTIIPQEGGKHAYWNVVERDGWIEKLKEVRGRLKTTNSLTIYGEFLGPGYQGNIYGLKENCVLAFDVKDGPLFASDWPYLSSMANLPDVPVLFEGTLRKWINQYPGSTPAEQLVASASGPSRMNERILREGIVIKPLYEMYSQARGRVILKVRDPVYLAKFDKE